MHVLLTDPAKHGGLKAGLSAEYEIAAKADGRNNTEVRFSVENGGPALQWGANLIASHEQGGDNDLGVALALRHEVRHGFAVGAEGQSSVQRAEGSQVFVTAYTRNEQTWAFKFGLGAERNGEGRFAPMARIALVLRLRG